MDIFVHILSSRVLMFKEYEGIVDKTSKGYILNHYRNSINITEELKFLWKLDNDVHITIESNSRQLLNENDCQIYYDRADKTKKYTFHINDIDIEQVLENAIGKQIYITVEYTLLSREEYIDDTNTCKS